MRKNDSHEFLMESDRKEAAGKKKVELMELSNSA